MFSGNNLVKDFELYLEKNNLWRMYHDNKYKWIEALGQRMDVAAKRTAEENAKLTDEDVSWWIDLCKLQKAYGNDIDIFGSYLEAKGLTSQQNGQFFTPMSICLLMVQISGIEIPGQTPMKVSDCASGTGRMMIAHAKAASEKEGYSLIKFEYYNQDIDYKSFIFSTLNASLRNLWSFNIWGDTLAVTQRKCFFTLPTVMGYATWHDKEHELTRINAAKKEVRKFQRLVG